MQSRQMPLLYAFPCADAFVLREEVAGRPSLLLAQGCCRSRLCGDKKLPGSQSPWLEDAGLVFVPVPSGFLVYGVCQ